MAKSKDQIQVPLKSLLSIGIPASIVILIATATATFILVKDIKQDHIDALETRIQGKGDLLDEYRERLHLTSKSSTAFSIMSNKELRDKALEVVSSIRDYFEKIENEDRRLSSLQYQEMQSAKTEAERQQVWSKYTNKLTQKSSEQQLYYSRTFQTDTILLRDEILTRLPKGNKDNKVYNHYEYPINQLCMTDVVNNLERIAKSLP